MACDIPAPSKETKVAMDFTTKQEVVKIDMYLIRSPWKGPPAQVPVLQALPEDLDNSHKIEIVLGKICIMVGDNAEPVMGFFCILDPTLRTFCDLYQPVAINMLDFRFTILQAGSRPIAEHQIWQSVR